MTFIPLFRIIIFTLVTFLSFGVLGICAHIEYLAAGYIDNYLSFAPLGLAASCLTIISLPLFLILGNRGQRVFTSMILFEIIWFFILWVVWVGTAGDTAAEKAYSFPGGCIYNHFPQANQTCHEFTVVEGIAFVNFFCAFIYYDVIFLYAIISAIRGRSIWAASIKEAAGVVPSAVNPALNLELTPNLERTPTTRYQTHGAYPSDVPQAYNAYSQHVPTPGNLVPPYNVYAQSVLPQGPAPQQYGVYPPQGIPVSLPDPTQQYNPQQWAGYAGYVPSPPAKDAPLPPQPNYGVHPLHSSQGQIAPQPSSSPLPPPYDQSAQTV